MTQKRFDDKLALPKTPYLPMKKILILIINLVIYVSGNPQELNDSTPSYHQLVEYYKTASQEERAVMDSLFVSVADIQRNQQVKQICGINFGSSISEARRVLSNKFGDPVYDPTGSNRLSFKNVKYAGISFDSIHFLFQSDGWQTYFYTCIFIKEAKSKKDIQPILDLYKELLSKKYNLSEVVGEFGFLDYGGGISPLWSGSPFELLEHLTAFHTDVIEYDSNLVDTFGNKYGVRIIYGPYNYVNEEF